MEEEIKIWNNKKVKVPVVIQMEAVECGAASLGMILAYYGNYTSLDILREECGVSRDGSKAINMAKAARKYGLTASGIKAEDVETLKEIKLPMIIFWNFNHFVVLTGIKNGKAYINDPAVGPRVLPLEDFDDSFTGFVMEFDKGAEFKKAGRKPSVLKPLCKKLSGSYLSLLFLITAGFLLVMPGLVTPIYSKIFIDNILIEQKTDWLYPLVFIMIVTGIITGLLRYLQTSFLLKIRFKLCVTSTAKFIHHIFRLPMNFFYQRYAGEIGNRIELNDSVADLLSGSIATNFINVFLIAFYAFLMFQFDTVLSLIAVFTAVLNLAYMKYSASKKALLNQKLVQENGKFMGVAMGGIQIIETLKSTGGENDFFSKFGGYQAKTTNFANQLAVTSIILGIFPGILGILNNTIILTYGASRVMQGFMTMGILVAFQALNSRFESPINGLMSLGTEIQTSSAEFAKIEDVMENQKSEFFITETKEEVADKIKLDGYLDINNLSFGYSKLAPPLIEEFNLSLKPGERVALVGGSGSGKSTMAKLISGIYSPWEGEILYDGLKRADYSRECINNSLAIVDQDIFMFKGTVAENISLWDETVSKERMSIAARDASIHADIASRVNGYENMLTEGGRNYSGGQRQRLEIARALIMNPSILILDEATSALDPLTEKEIMDNIKKRGCTCIVVAHRLSTIRDCDEIIVMDHGRIVQRGTHQELMKDSSGQYYSYIKMY